MNTIIRKGLTLASFTMLMSTGYSQFKISAEVRPRMEYRHGYKTLANSAMKSAAFVDQRTRLNFDYTKDRITFKLTLQDVRTWGSQKQLVGNEDFGMSVHEAWGQAKLNDNWALKFGRQELVYDDHRILGSVGWAQQARSHDALLIKYEKNALKLHIGGAYNQNKPQLNTTSYTVPKSYKTMQYLWANYKFSDAFKASFLAMGVGQQTNNFVNEFSDTTFQDNYTLTAGTRLVYKKDKLSAGFNAYYQMGSTNTWPARSVSAYNIGLDVSYQVTDPIKLTLGFEMLSGNSRTDTSASYAKTQHAFNPYFGTNHKFNGYMDYFYVGNYGGNVGLNDTYLKFAYKHKKFAAGFIAHAFMANTPVRDNSDLTTIKTMSSYLGSEIDLFGAFDLAPGAKCKVGYSQMFGTSTMETVKGGGDIREISNWGYVMIIIKPTLFEKK